MDTTKPNPDSAEAAALQDKELSKRKEAAIVIQKAFRGYRSREEDVKDLTQKGLEYYEAIVNGVAKIEGKEAIEPKTLSKGELDIVKKRAQEGSRSIFGNKDPQGGIEHTADQIERYKKILEKNAAKVIQRAFRNYRSKNVAKKTAEAAAAATIKIQSFLRGVRARNNFRDKVDLKYLTELEAKSKAGNFAGFDQDELSTIAERLNIRSAIQRSGTSNYKATDQNIKQRYEDLIATHKAKAPRTPEEFKALEGAAEAAIKIQAEWRRVKALRATDATRIRHFQKKLQDPSNGDLIYKRLPPKDLAKLEERMAALQKVIDLEKVARDRSNAKKGTAEINDANREPSEAEKLHQGYKAIKQEIAASLIQGNWKSRKPQEQKDPTNPDDDSAKKLEQEIIDYRNKQKTVIIDSLQFARERGIDATHYKSRDQSSWIEGVYGHTNYVTDNQGKPIGYKDDDGNPVTVMGPDGKPKMVEWDEHLGLKRARGLFNESIELGPDGFPVALYSNAEELQKVVDKIRKKHREWDLPHGKNPMQADQINIAFARYNDPQSKTQRYVMLVESRDGLTQCFVNSTVITNKIDKARQAFENPSYIKNVAKHYNEISDIADKDKRMETAHLMARQEIRDTITKEIIAEIGVEQEKHRPLRVLDKADLKRLTSDKKLQKGIVSAFMPHKVPPAVFKKESISVSKTARGADIFWDDGSEHDSYNVNIPDTNFFIKVHRALESREYMCWRHGCLVPVYREKGSVWIDENTVHYKDPNIKGAAYQPLCVHTDYLQINPDAKLLRDHSAAKNQFGGFGVSRAQKFIDNFAIKVRTADGVAVKVGRKVTSSLLDPIVNGNQINIKEPLPNLSDIGATNIGDSWQKSSDKFVECSPLDLTKNKPSWHNVTTNFSSPILVSQKLAKRVGLDLSKKDRKENEEVAEPLSKALETAFGDGPIFIKIKKTPKGGKLVEDRFYQDQKPFMLDKNTGEHIEITPEIFKNTIRELKKQQLDSAGNVIVGSEPLILEKDLQKYTDRFFKRFKQKVRVRYLNVQNEFEKTPEELRFLAKNASHKSEHFEKMAAMLVQHKKSEEAIEAKFTQLDKEGNSATQAEKDKFRREMNFDLNSADPVTGKTALHMAAISGREDAVMALIAAGVDPNIKDKKGKTASKLAREAGNFKPNDPNSWILKLESYEQKFKLDQTRAANDSLKKDSEILSARAEKLKLNLAALEAELAALKKEADKAFAADPTKPDEVKSTQNQLTAKLQELDKLRLKAIEAAKLELAAQQKLSEIDPNALPKIKPSKFLPNPDTHIILDYPVTVANDDGVKKKFYIRCYFAKEDGPVMVYVDGKEKKVMMRAGEIMFPKNTIFAQNQDGVLCAEPVYKLGGRADVPNGWNRQQWQEAAGFYENLHKKIEKGGPEVFFGEQETGTGKGDEKLKTNFIKPEGFQALQDAAKARLADPATSVSYPKSDGPLKDADKAPDTTGKEEPQDFIKRVEAQRRAAAKAKSSGGSPALQ